jgi:hypothetical protein
MIAWRVNLVRGVVCSYQKGRFQVSCEGVFTTEAQSSQSSEDLLIKNSLLRALRGYEKKFKIHQNCKFGLNEIKYLQLLIFAKRDFFSRPVSLW